MTIDIRDLGRTSQTSPSETGIEPKPIIALDGGAVVPPAPIEPAPPATTPTPELTPDPVPPAPASHATTPAAPDYRKKFGDSTRENQVLLGSLAEMKRVLGEVTSADIPTDEELAREYPEFDALSDFERNVLRKQSVQDRKLNKVLVIVDGVTTEAAKVQTISAFIDTRPELAGKEQSFLEFCLKPSHRGSPAETLLSAFLFEDRNAMTPGEPPAPTPVPAPAPRGLERGTPSGDAPSSIGPRKYSDEELRDLRTRDPKKYHEMIRKGQI